MIQFDVVVPYLLGVATMIAINLLVAKFFIPNLLLHAQTRLKEEQDRAVTLNARITELEELLERAKWKK